MIYISRIRSIPRWIRWVLIVVCVLLVVYLLIYALLTSSAITRYALEKVEAAVSDLSFSSVEGSLAGGLAFDLNYTSPAARIQVREGGLKLRLECLWQTAVCVESLRMSTLRVQLLEAKEEAEAPPKPDEEVALPAIVLPVDVFLESFQVDRLIVEQDGSTLYELEGLSAAMRWRASTLELEHLLARDPYCRWALQAEITLINRYPLSANLGCESVAGLGEATAELSGDLQKLAAELNARVRSDFSAEPVPIHLSLNLEPFDPQLPANLELRTRSPVVLKFGEQSLQLISSQLNAEGPLLNPAIRAQMAFESPYWPGRNRLNLSATASTEALNLDALRLQLPEGQVNGKGRLSYGEVLAWQADIDWSGVQLEQFSELVSGVLAGQVSTSGDNATGQLRAELALADISGTLLDRPFAASGDLGFANGNLSIHALSVRQGSNQMDLAGDLSTEDTMDLALRLDVPQLAALIPEDLDADASGAVHGDIRVSGSFEDPTLSSTLELTGARYQDIQLAQAQLALQWFGLGGRPGELDLRLRNLAVGEDLATNVRLQGQGSARRHSLSLDVDGLGTHEDKHLQLGCSGGFEVNSIAPWDHWLGQCARLILSFALPDPETWQLAEPIQIDLRPNEPRVSASDFCLRNGAASLCSEEAIRFARDELSPVSLRGLELPWEWLQPFLPGEGLRVQGDWQFAFRGEELLAEPRLSARVASATMGVLWAEDSLNIRDLEANWEMARGEHRANWRLESERSGSVEGQVTLREQELQGQATISSLQLADYAPIFLPEDSALRGEVNMELNLAGTLEEPGLSGEFRLSDGFFSNETLPVPLADIQLRVMLDNNVATADGRFRAAESDGRIGGRFSWEGEDWTGELALSAEPLLIEPQPDVQVQVAPDLKFAFAPGQLTLAGELRIPEARIEITALPEQAVTTSSDAVIVGQTEAEEGGPPMEISTDLAVTLGDKVLFEGFGLETRITGNLRLQQQGGEPMRANGKLQLLEGRYAAYGQNLAIRSGDLIFIGDIDNPQLRVEAVRADTPEDVVVGLRASGPARDPRVSLFSRPDMPQQAQLSYLLTGNPPGTEVETDPQLAAAEAALSYALESDLGTGITRRAGAALGIEDLQVTAGATDAGTQIGLSGYITPNLLVRYGVGVFDAVNTLTLRYQLTRSVYLEAISGEASDVGLMWSFERN